MNSQRGEINEMRDRKNIGYHVGRVKTVAVKRSKRIMSAKKPICRCNLYPSLEYCTNSNTLTISDGFHNNLEHTLSMIWSKCACKQEINSSISNHAIFMSLNPLILALLQVDYQTHPANVWGFLAGTCLYFLALELKRNINTRWASYSHILSHVLLISGAFSSFSLVSIFLPSSLGWLSFILWAILPLMAVSPLLVRVYHWFFHGIMKEKVGKFFDRFMGSVTVQQQQLPN